MLGDLWLWIKAQFCFHDYKRVHCINGYTFYQCSKCGRTRKSIKPPFFLDYKKKMTIKEYIDFAELLKANGYRKYNGSIVNEDYYWCRGFEYQVDENGDRSPAYQVIYSVWDYRDKPHLRVPDFDRVGVCAKVIMSGDGRIDLELTKDEFDINDIETKAQSFYGWVKENFNICE